MTLADLYSSTSETSSSPRQLPISFELYPPRNADPSSHAWAGIDRLLDARPDYVSVTFGTGKNTARSSQSALTRAMKRSGRPALAHLVCLGRRREELVQILHDMMDLGVRDFLALRGDPPRGESNWVPAPQEFGRAVQLVSLVHEVAADYLGDARAVSVAVAAYPSGDVATRTNTVAALAEKESAGADFAITQVFYNAKDYAQLLQSASYQGVSLPVVPGIIPFTDIDRLRRLETLTGVPVPSYLKEIAEIEDPSERIIESLGATLDFVNDLIEVGAPGLHFYTFNRARPVLDLVQHLRARGFGHVEASESADLMGLVSAAMHRVTP